MKSASNYWVFIFLSSLLFNCATRKSDSIEGTSMQKAYVVLRTEGLDAEINKFISVLNSNFVTNKIASDINHYAIGRTWKIDEIFSTAYNNNYDYIILIDQVAKFTIDNRTNIGGKYQIRSYPIKSSNPDWIDLGQKTCNIAVRKSIDKFSEQIISQITPNYGPSKVSSQEEQFFAEKEQTHNSEIDYNQLKSSEEMDIEIADLRKQLEQEKERTNKVVAEKEELEKKYERALNFQKEKNQSIIEGLESYKKENEPAEVKINGEKTITELKKEEVITFNQTAKPSQKQKRVKAKRVNSNVKRSSKKNLKTHSSKTNESTLSFKKSINKSNALLIIRGKEEELNSFNDLKDNLEFELINANIKATTHIINFKKVVNKEDILSFNKHKYKYLVFIEHYSTTEDDLSIFTISVYTPNDASTWKDIEQTSYNLEDDKSLKEFAQTVLRSL
ncbi:MAG: hypothetical protein HKO81_05830 [Flavobacteriaceae bacterium]|nr:hypothetical protein [Flavobacteriaceae bacterium]